MASTYSQSDRVTTRWKRFLLLGLADGHSNGSSDDRCSGVEAVDEAAAAAQEIVLLRKAAACKLYSCGLGDVAPTRMPLSYSSPVMESAASADLRRISPQPPTILHTDASHLVSSDMRDICTQASPWHVDSSHHPCSRRSTSFFRPLFDSLLSHITICRNDIQTKEIVPSCVLGIPCEASQAPRHASDTQYTDHHQIHHHHHYHFSTSQEDQGGVVRRPRRYSESTGCRPQHSRSVWDEAMIDMKSTGEEEKIIMLMAILARRRARRHSDSTYAEYRRSARASSSGRTEEESKNCRLRAETLITGSDSFLAEMGTKGRFRNQGNRNAMLREGMHEAQGER
ncbi:hypothetical protein KP509_19G036900 [Ceratopteris richardii]|uniref:Uncharacterized protein n=2 Tax=Ceratopteris richardii TaxID=49495 RepID=A0A8T2SLD1_CERRI|nr:hypothetical protein KP509_19G036900 [Ceratopteris richardii]KAH7352252.1 hypothetical protein KP509_19G036900 [Ceratopteris richardii]KAH7352253.1 hypothetical protein KP509_19G036900 [Ceratopteris richardii]